MYIYICICIYFCAHTHTHMNLAPESPDGTGKNRDSVATKPLELIKISFLI